MNTEQNKTEVVLMHSELTDRIIGIFFDVYNELGSGFLESVYQRALIIALRDAGLKVEHEVPLTVLFRGHEVGSFRADLLVESAILIELKAAQTIERIHEAQVLNYLRGTSLEIGLLLNFGPRPQFRRLLLTNDRKPIRANPCKSVARAGQ